MANTEAIEIKTIGRIRTARIRHGDVLVLEQGEFAQVRDQIIAERELNKAVDKKVKDEPTGLVTPARFFELVDELGLGDEPTA
jgi:hypothetical protein